MRLFIPMVLLIIACGFAIHMRWFFQGVIHRSRLRRSKWQVKHWPSARCFSVERYGHPRLRTYYYTRSDEDTMMSARAKAEEMVRITNEQDVLLRHLSQRNG